jgi:hypothetical protein
MARHHVAAYHIKDAPGISADLHRAAMERLRPERKNRQFDGDCVGEIVKMLLTLIHCHADKASWQSAIGHVSEYARNKAGASPSLYWKRLGRFAPVLHFWGALACRFRSLHLNDPSVGYSRDDDARAFVTEAQRVLEYLHAWDDARGKSERSSYLAVDAFGPWADMRPFERQPEWPDTGTPRAFGPLSDSLLRRPDGTTIVKPRGWQKGRARIFAQ